MVKMKQSSFISGITDELHSFSIFKLSSEENYAGLKTGNNIGKCDDNILKFINLSLDNFLKSKVFDFTIFKPLLLHLKQMITK